MDEFNRIAWERNKMINMYPRQPRIHDFPEKPSRTLGGIATAILFTSMGVMVGLLTWEAVTEHFKPAQPVALKQETAPDVTGQIRTLERMIAEAKQLNTELATLHDQFTAMEGRLK